eukprot:763728-Amphidinium_carterae.1
MRTMGGKRSATVSCMQRNTKKKNLLVSRPRQKRQEARSGASRLSAAACLRVLLYQHVLQAVLQANDVWTVRAVEKAANSGFELWRRGASPRDVKVQDDWAVALESSGSS